MSRFSPKVLVAGALLLALGVLLTLRLTSTVTSPVGGFERTGPGPSAGTAAGATVPTATDLRGSWTPRVVLGERVHRAAPTLDFRTEPARAVAWASCNRHVYRWVLDATGGLHVDELRSTGLTCSYQPGGTVDTAVALGRTDRVPIRQGRLELRAADGRVLAVLDRARR